ncbi:MAG TPA: M23 family metallopeptidase [Acidimicrobiales bacterium]|nr:M23 family metallopeptidase [Acidimicrobiales bacterium]
MSQRFRSPFAVLVALVALTLLVIGPAGAQTPPPTTAPATTSTTAPDLLGDLLHQLLPTTTVAPAAPPTTAAAPRPSAAANPAAPGGSTTTTTTPPGVIPPEYVPIINSVHRTGSRTTSALIDALHPLTDLGFTAQEAAIAGFGHFPVAGLTDWSDNWLEPRFTPTFHLHQGDDLFAARGTPVRAPFDGVVRFAPNEGAGGNAAYLTVPDGTYYYMAHLDSVSTKISSGAKVKQGDVLGFTGDTGDATGGATHVHFEIHPGGGAAVDPSAILDGWITDAINGAAALLVTNNAGASRAITGAGVLRSFEDQSPSPSGRAVGPLLWASSQSAGGGTIRIAELQVARLAGRIDWDRQTSMAHAAADALQAGRTVATAVLGPVTPPALMPLLRGGS